MKLKCAVWIVVILLICQVSNGQTLKQTVIDPTRLSITYNKTTNLIFQYPIKSVDRGSKDILTQKAIGVENVLQVKAAKQGFDETNLTVITSDGSLFSFILNYALMPSGMNIRAEIAQSKPESVAVFSEQATTDQVKSNAQKVLAKRRSISNKRDVGFDMIFDLKGIYVANEVFYLQLFLRNTSMINYDVKSLKLYIRDMKKSRRTASQEVEVEPVFTFGGTSLIAGQSECNVVIAVPKFTIPEKKRLELELLEGNGGRNLTIRLNNSQIMHAKTVE